MAVSKKIKAIIEQEMAALKKDEFLRLAISFEDFLDEYTTLLARASQDKDALTAAGFDFSVMQKYKGYLVFLAEKQAARVLAEADKGAAAQRFAEGKSSALKDKRIMMTAAKYIVQRTGSKEDKKLVAQIRKGNSELDSLNDNVALVGFMRQHAALAQQVRPGGTFIDQVYLSRVEQEAMDLLKLRAESLVAVDNRQVQLDAKRRIITLCLKAQAEIKLFAQIAFYDDTARYNQYYASPAARKNRGTVAKPTSSVG